MIRGGKANAGHGLWTCCIFPFSLPFLNTDNTDYSKYGLVEQIHPPCDHHVIIFSVTKNCFALIAEWSNKIVEFTLRFYGKGAHWHHWSRQKKQGGRLHVVAPRVLDRPVRCILISHLGCCSLHIMGCFISPTCQLGVFWCTFHNKISSKHTFPQCLTLVGCWFRILNLEQVNKTGAGRNMESQLIILAFNWFLQADL